MKQKRVNPRRVPATLADVRRAKDLATEEAVKAAWSILFTVLRDKEGYTNEDLQRTWGEVNDLSDSITRGYVSVWDLRNTLREEAGVDIK